MLMAAAVHRLLRGGVGMDGGHQAFLNAKALLEEHVDERSEAVGGAARVGDDVVLGGVVLVVVHAHHDGDVLALGRGGDDDLLGTGDEVALGLLGLGEEAGGLDDDVHVVSLPGELVRGLGADDMDVLAVDHEDVVLGLVRAGLAGGNRAREAALGGVVLQEVGEVVGGNEVAHGDDVDVLPDEALLDEGAEDEAADAAETIDGDVDWHSSRILGVNSKRTDETIGEPQRVNGFLRPAPREGACRGGGWTPGQVGDHEAGAWKGGRGRPRPQR